MEIKTERLIIIPMTEAELQVLIHQYQDTVPELSMAYQEMYDHCRQYPEEYIWYTSWKICLADSLEMVGDVGFKGYRQGAPEIGYGIIEAYEGKGYATEAVKGLCKWAFDVENVPSIEAETETDNLRSQRVLEKNGFEKSGIIGEEGPRFILSKKGFLSK